MISTQVANDILSTPFHKYKGIFSCLCTASDSIKIKEISISLEQITYKINPNIYKINFSLANNKLLHTFAASSMKIFGEHNQ
jgi:hypothetical protein